ncbi:MAG: thiamine pyrophosphate protein domain protein tpp-binding [Glaciihabitans sp.]|nr:thiamine pyrophosphate protein domain protein tpp-binding [Glaciihabitans sp.]
MTRTGGRLLIDSLVHNGVDFATCVPGESFLAVLDAIYEVNDGHPEPVFRLVTARHEAAAANMAEAVGKLTLSPAVCLVTRGPGAMHASIALHTAFQDGTPLVLVIGQVATSVLGREAFQEMDYSAVFGSTAKHVVQVTDPDRIGEQVARALYLAMAGRPGPVVIVVPEDVLTSSTDKDPVSVPAISHPEPSRSDLESLVSRLENAERPLLVVGGPSWSAEVGDDITAFAEANGIPIAAAFRWQDCVDNRSENYVGYLGLGCSPALRARAREADLVVAFGPRLDDPTTDGFVVLDAPTGERALVMVSEDAADAVTNTIPDEVITTSVAALAAELRRRTLRPSGARAEWTRVLRSEFLAYTRPTETPGDVDLARIIKHVRSVTADDTIVTTGAGNYTVWVQRFFEFRQFGTQLAPRNGAMGYGYPAAIGAAAVRSGSPVIAFAGDGCILMSGSELATAMYEQLRVILIVVNNGMFGTIRMHQENHYPGHVIATDLSNPDFTEYGKSFGAQTHLVERTEQFAAAFAAALVHEGPSLIELRTDPLQLTPDRRLAHTSTGSAT